MGSPAGTPPRRTSSLVIVLAYEPFGRMAEVEDSPAGVSSAGGDWAVDAKGACVCARRPPALSAAPPLHPARETMRTSAARRRAIGRLSEMTAAPLDEPRSSLSAVARASLLLPVAKPKFGLALLEDQGLPSLVHRRSVLCSADRRSNDAKGDRNAPFGSDSRDGRRRSLRIDSHACSCRDERFSENDFH